MAVKVDKARAERAIREFLLALGHDEESLDGTPERVTAAYADELLSGYQVDLKELVHQGSEPTHGSHEPILLEGIDTATVCPHHLLVAQGKASVAYVPQKRILGLGTIAKLVHGCSKRLVLQEQIAQDIVNILMKYGEAEGAFCRIEFNHACLRTRGATQPHAIATSWASAGSLKDVRILEIALGRPLVSPQ